MLWKYICYNGFNFRSKEIYIYSPWHDDKTRLNVPPRHVSKIGRNTRNGVSSTRFPLPALFYADYIMQLKKKYICLKMQFIQLSSVL